MVRVGGSQWDKMVAAYNLLASAMSLKDQGHFGTKEPQSHSHPYDQWIFMVRKGTEDPEGAGIPAGPAGPPPIMVSDFPGPRAATAAAQQITAKVTFFIQQFM